MWLTWFSPFGTFVFFAQQRPFKVQIVVGCHRWLFGWLNDSSRESKLLLLLFAPCNQSPHIKFNRNTAEMSTIFHWAKHKCKLMSLSSKRKYIYIYVFDKLFYARVNSEIFSKFKIYCRFNRFERQTKNGARLKKRRDLKMARERYELEINHNAVACVENPTKLKLVAFSDVFVSVSHSLASMVGQCMHNYF